MKKVVLTISIVMALAMSASAQMDGMFRGGDCDDGYRAGGGSEMPLVPAGTVGTIPDSDAAPLSSGLLILTALGAGYAMRKNKDK